MQAAAAQRRGSGPVLTLACTPHARYFPVLSAVQLPSWGTRTGDGEESSGTAMRAPVTGSMYRPQHQAAPPPSMAQVKVPVSKFPLVATEAQPEGVRGAERVLLSGLEFGVH